MVKISKKLSIIQENHKILLWIKNRYIMAPFLALAAIYRDYIAAVNKLF